MKTLPIAVALVVFAAVAASQTRAVGPADRTEGHENGPYASRLHAYFNWAKLRLDEMDAALAIWERKAAELRGDVGAKRRAKLQQMKTSGPSLFKHSQNFWTRTAK